MFMQKIPDFLNSQQTKFVTINYSSGYTQEEVESFKNTAGIEFVETLLVEVDKEKIAMVIIPAHLHINLGSLQEALGTTQVRLLEQEEVKKIFPDCEFRAIPPFGNLYAMDVYLAEDIQDNQEVIFYCGSYHQIMKMSYSDFKNIVNPRLDIVFKTRSTYKALMHLVYPESARDKILNHQLNEYNHCILGVSLENMDLVAGKLVEITYWISKYFKNCTVLIGDSLHRLTLQADRGWNENKALNKALLMGREYLDRHNPIFTRHADSCNFTVLFSSEIAQGLAFEQYRQTIQEIYQKDEKFAQAVQSFAEKFARRPHRLSNHPEYLQFRAEMSCRYQLEELAIFACLAEQGLSVIVYPGSLDIFAEIATGEHPQIPTCLQKIVHISLDLRKR